MKLDRFETNYIIENFLGNINGDVSEMENAIKNAIKYTSEPHGKDGDYSDTQYLTLRRLDGWKSDLVNLQGLSGKLSIYLTEVGI